MTRVIAGEAGGVRLAVPKGTKTRPTSDRVREAVFSRLDHLDVLAGAVVLDLYAGSRKATSAPGGPAGDAR